MGYLIGIILTTIHVGIIAMVLYLLIKDFRLKKKLKVDDENDKIF